MLDLEVPWTTFLLDLLLIVKRVAWKALKKLLILLNAGLCCTSTGSSVDLVCFKLACFSPDRCTLNTIVSHPVELDNNSIIRNKL